MSLPQFATKLLYPARISAGGSRIFVKAFIALVSPVLIAAPPLNWEPLRMAADVFERLQHQVDIALAVLSPQAVDVVYGEFSGTTPKVAVGTIVSPATKVSRLETAVQLSLRIFTGD